MKHKLKIKETFANRILEGLKDFEIRINDRDYQVGDTIAYTKVDDKDPSIVIKEFPVSDHQIKYIHSGFGMQEGFVVLGIERQEAK